MMNTLLNIAGKIDASAVGVYEQVSQVAEGLNIPYVVVGASARDIVLHYAHGANIERATMDIDFGVQVSDWDSFMLVRQELLKVGFRETQRKHRLISVSGIQIDIVPFGHVQDENANIKWPPKGDVVMNVMGFQEAYDHADIIRINNEPEIDVRVATPIGMILLKLIAWTDRDRVLRRKDATDIAYLLSTYEKIPSVMGVLYEDKIKVTEKYDWDISQSSAHLLGEHSCAISQQATKQVIMKLFQGELKASNIEILTEEMCKNIEDQYERNRQLLAAFFSGFNI